MFSAQTVLLPHLNIAVAVIHLTRLATIKTGIEIGNGQKK
jgi:hypothetical protein